MANSAFFRELILQLLLEAVGSVSIHEADPGEVGGAEIATPRQPVALIRTAPGTLTNENVMVYRDLPAATVTHFGLWDVDGNFLLGGQCANARQVLAEQQLEWAANDLVIRF